MITANISGKLAFDASEIKTKSGVPMTKARVACDDGSGGTLWVDVIGFKGYAEWLATCIKGNRISAMGVLKINRWETPDGEEREQLQLVADSLICPGAKPKAERQPAARGRAAEKQKTPDKTYAPDDPFAREYEGEACDDLPF